MTDEKKDLLEEAKRQATANHQTIPEPHIVVSKETYKKLIEEVDRLRGLFRQICVCMANNETEKLAKLVTGEVLADPKADYFKELEKQIASLTKERDELQVKLDYWYKDAGTQSSNVDFQVKEKQKLEADNAELKEEAKRWSLDMGQRMDEIAELKAKVAELTRIASHSFMPDPKTIDENCRGCGMNIRHEVHKRL